ncbi:MAG: hypothetical protein HYT39_01135 [Candidatus Sungbacteria bacterium]|nr:hypothetical protein [Candidatus Sungbacteria bacterium]
MGILAREFSFNAKYARPVLAWLVVFGLITAAAFHAKFYTNQRAQESRLISVLTGKGDLVDDPDQDGLKNWEEDLWKTDKANPDTDGDGISDGGEVKAGRDPLTPGPGNIAFGSTPGAGSANVTRTLTETIIKNGGIQSVLNKKPVPEIPAADLEAASAAYQKSVTIAAQVSEKDIIIQDTADKNAIKNYYNSVAGIIQKNFGTLYRNDIALLYEILQSPDQKYRFGLFKYYVAAAAAAERELRALPTPKPLVDFHIFQIGLMAKTKTQFEAFRNAADDPMAALIAVQDREATLAQLAGLYGSVVPQQIKELELSFNANDPAKKLFRLP